MYGARPIVAHLWDGNGQRYVGLGFRSGSVSVVAQWAVLQAPCDDLVRGIVERNPNMDMIAVGDIALLASVMPAADIA